MGRMSQSIIVRLILALASSAGCLWLVFHSVDLSAVYAHVAAVPLSALLKAGLAWVVVLGMRVVRWGILVQAFAPLRGFALWRIANIGMLAIFILPLRLGEFVRPYLLSRHTGAPLSSGLASVAVERVIDGLMVTLIFFVSTALLPAGIHVPPPLMAAAWSALAIFGAALVCIVGALISQNKVEQLLLRLGTPIAPGLTQKVVGLLGTFIGGLRALPDPKAGILLIGSTLAYWTINAWGMHALMLGMGWDLPLTAGFTVVGVLALGIMIPAGPGFLGTFQGSIVWGLGIFAVAADEAAAYSLAAYGVTVLVQLLMGLIWLNGSMLRLEDLKQSLQAGRKVESLEQ